MGKDLGEEGSTFFAAFSLRTSVNLLAVIGKEAKKK